MNDKLQQLYNLYKDNGLITIDFNTFASANDNQRKKLYDLGVQQGLFSTTPYDAFSSAFSGIQPQQQAQPQQRELPRMPKPGELANIGKEDKNATFDSQGNYHPENAVPASLRPLSQKVAADREAKKKEEERIFRQEQIAKVNQQREADQLASQFDLSAQQSLVESTARQQQEASSSASQRYEAAAEKFPILRNELLKDVYQQLQKEQDLPDFVKNQLESITPDLINLGEYGPGMSSGLATLAAASPLAIFSGAMSQNVAGLSVEEAVVPKMNYMFGPLGFTFEESGMTGDYMIVTAPNKDKIEISLNNFTQSSNQEEAKKLKNFIATNSTKIPQIEKIAAQYAGSNAKISSEKDVDNAISKVNNEYNALNADAETLTKDINVFENELNAFNSTPAALRNTPEYIEKKNLLDATLLDINKRRQDLIAKNSQIQANQAMVEKSVGKYAQMKAQQGTWIGASYSWLGEGAAEIGAGLMDLGTQMSPSSADARRMRAAEEMKYASSSDKVATGNIEEDAKQGGFVVEATRRLNNYNKSRDNYEDIIPEPKQGQTYKDWYNSLSNDQKNDIRDKIEDIQLKKTKEIAIPKVRESIQGTLLDPNTSVEWKELAQENWWVQAYASLLKSAPAMALRAVPGVGGALSTGAFFAQNLASTEQEMSSNPAFADVPESEKMLIKIPIAVASAVLEEVGLSNLIKNRAFVSSLVTKGLAKAGVNATEKEFAKIIKNDIESMLARGTLTLAGAALAEGETGAMQQVSDYAIKDIYNLSKGKKMFNTPDSAKEYALDILNAGAQEAVGGMIMGTYPAAAAAYRKRGFEGMSNDEFKTFEATANDGMMQSAYISTLKTKVASGDMTMAEAKEELNDYRRSVGVYRSVDTELSTEDKKKAMNLISEKNALTQQIEGKDEAIVSRQKNRIAEINTQLNKLSENAVQEQATSEVPVQSETTISEEVEGGKPTTEPQVTTEEVKEEEVVPVLRTAESTTTALESLPEGERTNITFMQEDGTELPIMGNETMLAELFQQAQAVPVDERTEFHESVIDAVNVALSDQIEEEQVQMQEQESNPFENIAEDNEQIVFEADNLEDIPEQFRGGAVESGPQEITARKKILGLPVGRKEVVKRKGTTFKFVVTGAEAKANANLLSPLFDNGKIRYDRTLERKARATEKATLFENVSKSLASVLPNLGVRNFKTSEELKSYVDSKYKGSAVSKQVLGSEGGLIIYDKDGKPAEILINETTSGATTLPHEVWHALLVKAFGENEALFKEFRDSIIKTLADNGYQDIVNTLNAFSSTPEYKASNKQAQEWLVEFGGLLTASGITPKNLNPQARTLLEQIKAVFNKIAMEMLGEPLFLENATAEDVLDFMVSISDAMSRGEDISRFFSPEGKATAKGKASTVSKQMGQGSPAEEVRRIAQRYNVNNNGFAPAQINEFALDKELRPYGYSAKRAAPDANGRQRGVYILNPKGKFYNPFKGKFQKATEEAQISEPKKAYNAKVLANKLSRITSIPVKFIDDPKQRFRGKIEDRVAIINMAYVKADTPIHEIIGHPVIASLKQTDKAFYNKLVNEIKNSKQGNLVLDRIKESYSEYSEDQQMEEAIVEMLSLMVSDRLENNSALKKLLTKILDDIIKFINKTFKTNFGKNDVINLTSLSKDIENYVNEVEGNLNRDIKSLVDLFMKNDRSTYLSVVPNQITTKGRDILKKKYKSESLSRTISDYIVSAPLYADKFIELVDNLLLDPSQAKAFLSDKQNLSYVNYLFSKLIDPNVKQEREKVEDPFKLLSQVDYDFIPIKDFDQLWSFKADYDKGYVICTFKSKEEAQGRLDNSFVFWIRKPYASEILPYDMLTQEYLESNSADAAEWRQYLSMNGFENADGTFRIPKRPSIYDPYAVSSISLQIHKDPTSTFQKMVNRYNHEIDISKGGDGVADAAFGNRLDNIIEGLESSVRDYVDLPQKEIEISSNVVKFGDKLFVYNSQIGDYYFSDNSYIELGRIGDEDVYEKINPDTEILSPGYLFNRKNGTVTSFGSRYDDFFDDAVGVQFVVDAGNRTNVIVTHKDKSETTLVLDDSKNIVSLSSNKKNIGDDFLENNTTIKSISLPLVEKIGERFLFKNNSLESIDIPKVTKIGKSFMPNNNLLKDVNLPLLQSVDLDFLRSNNSLLYLELPSLKKIVGNFMEENNSLIAFVAPELKTPGWGFLSNNNSLRFLELPSATTIQNGFLPYSDNIEYAFLGYSPYIVDKNINDNNIYQSLRSFKNKNYSQAFSQIREQVGAETMNDLLEDFFSGVKVTVQEFIDFAQETEGVTFSAQRGGTLQESVEKIPGYDRMIQVIDGIVKKSTARGRTQDEIMDNVMAYVTGPRNAVYQRANDSQREQLVRDVRAMFGKTERSAPSVGKLFDTIKDIKMITMSEAELLKQQIRSLARGAKDAKMSWMAISKQVAKQIKELVVAGKISNRQAASVISRMAMVNMFNQDSVDKFVDYMTKVFNDANYDKKINDARKRLPRALKNIKKKIGVAKAVAPSLFQLFSINPNLIPDSVLERYLELVEMFGSSDSVLKLDNVSVVAQDVKKILDAVNEEVSQSEELALRFENFVDKVYDEDGKLDYAKTLAKMVETDAITDAEAEIMRKYKKNILPKVEEPAKTEAEIEEEKKAIIKAIKSTTINASELPTRLERDLANRLVELLNPKYLKNLSVNQLENVMKLIDNINNGYLPRYAMITVEKLNSIKQASENLVPAVETAKPLKFSQFVGKVKALNPIKVTSAALEMIRRTPLFYIDQIFGDFNSKRIFNSVFEGMAKGHAAFESDMNRVNKRLDDAREAVAKSNGYNANKNLEASFRMMAYMIQLEYESNPGSDQVNPAARFIEATINHIYDGKSKYKEADAKLLENILDKYGVNVGTDKKGNPIREIDINKLYKSFNKAERSALETIRELNDGLTEKAQYTASVIRGESITPLNNYVHLPVMHDYNPNERSTGIQNSDAYNNSRKPSTKAKTLEGRSGKVSPINFDAFASAQKGVKYTLLDFHMTEPIRTSRKTIKEARELMKKNGDFKGQNRQLLNAIDNANEEVIRNVLTNNFINDTGVDAVVNEISKQGYRAILASSERFTAELASNIAFAVISDPKSFNTGIKYKSVIMSPSAVNIMDNVGSKQTKRLFSGDTLTGRLIDTSILGQASGIKSVRSKSAISNAANIIYNKSLKKYKNAIELTADALISTPDKLVMRPVWFGAFANEFKNQTGEEIDFDKIANNDEAYMNKYSEAISNARNFADEKSVLTGASDNPFMGIIKGNVTADQGNIMRVYNNFNNFMTRFAIYEFAAARQGIYAAMGNGTLTKKQGYALLAGVATRMTTYTLLTKIIGSLVLSMFGIDDEEEETEKSFLQNLSQALASTATSLIIGRDFGNAVKTVSNFGVEKVNEEFFTALRNGEYDPYNDYISYSSVPKAKPGNPVDFGDIALMFTGSFTPFAKTIDLGVRKAFEDPKKEPAAIERQKNEILVRFPIEVLGNMGLIPMYKDVKNVVIGSIYEGLKKEMKAEKDKSKKEETKKKKTRRSGRSSRRGSRTGSR